MIKNDPDTHEYLQDNLRIAQHCLRTTRAKYASSKSEEHLNMVEHYKDAVARIQNQIRRVS